MFHGTLAGESCDSESAAQYAFDIAIEDGGVCSKAEGSDGICRRATNAGQRRQCQRMLRKVSAVIAHHTLRTTMQVAGAGVVAQPAPQTHDFIDRRSGKISKLRKARQKACVIRDDRSNLGLLQHDFGKPDAIGVSGVLPRQIMPAVGFVPVDEGG